MDEDYLIRYLGEKSAGDRRNLFYLRFIQEEKEKNQYITFGRVEHVENLGAKSAYCSSKVFVYALSKNKEFLIFFKRYDNNFIEPAYVDGKPAKRYGDNAFVHKVAKNDIKGELVTSELASAGIDMDSIVLSYYISPYDKLYDYDYNYTIGQIISFNPKSASKVAKNILAAENKPPSL